MCKGVCERGCVLGCMHEFKGARVRGCVQGSVHVFEGACMQTRGHPCEGACRCVGEVPFVGMPCR